MKIKPYYYTFFIIARGLHGGVQRTLSRFRHKAVIKDTQYDIPL